MAEFLTTNGTTSSIESILRLAKKEIYLVSPFLQISDNNLDRLKEASENGIDINIIYGKEELKPSERSSLDKISKLKLYFYKHLHAKCYFNESQMVITSMNLYGYSEKNNKEMGVLINCIEDHKAFEDAKRETLSILRLSEDRSHNRLIEPIVIKKVITPLVDELTKKKDPIQSSMKIGLEVIKKYLSDEFKDSKINSGSDYLFSKNLVPLFDVFVRENVISLKLASNYRSIECLNNISGVLKQHPKYTFTIEEPVGGYAYYLVDINNCQSLKDYSDLISILRKIKV